MRMTAADYSSQLAFDVKGLNDLKRDARANTPAANKAVAQQFEALFLQTVLKSMRDATPHEGMFDSEQSRMFESMYDQQLTQVLATRSNGTGLAALIEKQLSRLGGDVQPLGDLPFSRPAPALPLAPPSAGIPLSQLQGAPSAALRPLSGVAAAVAGAPSASLPSIPAAGTSSGSRDFIGQVLPHALEASRTTGIPAHFMVAQAALETGWGKSEPRLPSGLPSYNLFGIKADRSWTGPVVTATTTEVVNGLAQRQTAQFRAYSSYGEAFQDYARLLASSPRYASVLGTRDAATFAQGLQQAGYATDPLYAAKLTRIIAGNTLRSGLPQA